MMLPGGTPILVLSQNTERQSGRKVQVRNIHAAKAVSDVIRTCLGPKSMLKMLLDPMGGVVMTNDGNCILREITAQHPAAKSMIEISRTQDEEVGDGTTSVIVLAGELLLKALPFIEQSTHPTVIINAYRQALDDAINILNTKISKPIDIDDTDEMLKIIMNCLRTKVVGNWGDKACQMALEAVRRVQLDAGGRTEIDIKRYARVEKIPGGSITDSCVLDGVMLNKDVTHSKMRRYIKNPRIMLLDCNLEFKKGESQTEIEISKEEDFTKILQLEEKYIKDICADIIKLKPDVLFTEKGVSDLAQHYLVKANITAIRRVRKSDNNRIARACGATVANRVDELREEDIGTKAGLFKIEKIGDEYFTFVVECEDPKACTILLRGASKDILSEVDRSLQDAMCVARNVMLDPYLVPGGGAVEMAVSQHLMENSRSMMGIQQWPYRAVADALEIIPRTLIQNCGGDVLRNLNALRHKHTEALRKGCNSCWGVDGVTGQIIDMDPKNRKEAENELDYGIWEPLSVKLQTYKTAIETAIMLLRIDDILSGIKKKEEHQPISTSQQTSDEMMKE